MTKKEVTKVKEVKYVEKEYNYVLSCDLCGKEIFSGDSKERLHEKEKECYKIVKPIYGKMGVEGEETIHFCGRKCYENYISKEFMRITKIPMFE